MLGRLGQVLCCAVMVRRLSQFVTLCAALIFLAVRAYAQDAPQIRLPAKAISTSAAKIRALNDQFRRTFNGGAICITRAVSERCDVSAVLAAVQAFDTFNEANDPFREHDFGALDFEGETIFWKIDFYSNDMQHGSPDASDPSVTQRILTVLLAEEY